LSNDDETDADLMKALPTPRPNDSPALEASSFDGSQTTDRTNYKHRFADFIY